MDYSNPYARFGVNMNPMQGIQQPGMWQNPVQPQPPMQLIKVSGMDGAKAYQMSPNSSVALFDENNDIMYVKTTDGAGFPTIRTFSFAPMEQPAPQNAQYVTHDELNSVIANIQEMISNAQQPVPSADPTAKSTRTRKPAASGQSD